MSLKPCPFCRSTRVADLADPLSPHYEENGGVMCLDCGAAGPEEGPGGAKWNTRFATAGRGPLTVKHIEKMWAQAARKSNGQANHVFMRMFARMIERAHQVEAKK